MQTLETKKFSRYTFELLQVKAEEFLKQMEKPPTITACDHVCYVVKSQKRFDELQEKLLEKGELIHELEEGQFEGSRFAIFKIKEKEVFNGIQFNVIELKLSDSDKLVEGFQHVEYIIYETLQELVNLNPNVQFETHRIDDPKNKEIGALLKSREIIGIKFREESLLAQF